VRLVADQAVSYVDYYFADQVEQLVTLPAEAIDARSLRDADALLIRSKTLVTEQLLTDSKLQFVLSAVSGSDHITPHLPVDVFCARGCNAEAVQQYVSAVLDHLSVSKAAVIGVVGVGAVGSKVCAALNERGNRVLCNDPLRTVREPTFLQNDLTTLLPQVDVLCLHTPLTFDGDYPTAGLIDLEALEMLRPGSLIVHVGRGGVLDEEALLLQKDRLTYCLDVWQHEPDVSETLLDRAVIATPHIAGHTWHGKVNGTHQCYHYLARQLGWAEKALPAAPTEKPHAKLIEVSESLKRKPAAFQRLRQEYCLC